MTEKLLTGTLSLNTNKQMNLVGRIVVASDPFAVVSNVPLFCACMTVWCLNVQSALSVGIFDVDSELEDINWPKPLTITKNVSIYLVSV